MLIKDAMTEKPQSPVMNETAENEGATDGEQQEYERMVLAGVSAISDETMSKSLVNIMQQTENPEEGLSEAAALLVGEIDSRGDFSETVILPASGEILENVAELAKSAKIYELDQNTLQGAADLLEIKLAEMYGVDPQDPEFQQMLQNTDQSEIEKMVGKYGGPSA